MASAERVPLTSAYTEIATCRMSGSPRLSPLLSLGPLPLTGVFPENATVDLPVGPLDLVVCPDGGLVQLRQSYAPADLYGATYGYRSGINASMARHLADIVATLVQRRPLSEGDVVLDIGSNDGTLLSAYPSSGGRLIGMDPTAAKFAEFYPPHVTRVPDFFSALGYLHASGGRRARLVTSIAMLYDLDAPLTFMQKVSSILASDGLWYTEQSYLPAMIEALAYDTICQEHLEYYGLTQLQWMADRADLHIVSAERNAINGGSLAVIFAPRRSSHVADTRGIEALLAREAELQLLTPAAFVPFLSAVAQHRRELPALIRQLRADGATVFGYGASTKGNVLLHACGLTVEDLPCIADANPDKHGRVTPGTKIPIVSEDEARRQRPDYFLVLPWHFREHIIQREQAFLKAGGGLIFPLPMIEIVRQS